MKNGILKLMRSTAGLLTFALICGAAYFIVILNFIKKFTEVGGGMLGFFFFPTIICGAALVLIKIIKQCLENGREGAVLSLFWLHVIFILMSVVFLIAMF